MQAKNPYRGTAAWLWLHRLTDRCLRFTSVLWARFQKNLLNLRAMALAYTTLVSLVPFLAVTFSVLKAFGIQHQLEPLLVQGLQPLGGVRGAPARCSLALLDAPDQGNGGIEKTYRPTAAQHPDRKMIDELNEPAPDLLAFGTPGGNNSATIWVVLVGPLVVSAAFALIASAQSHAVRDILAGEELTVDYEVVEGLFLSWTTRCHA